MKKLIIKSEKEFYTDKQFLLAIKRLLPKLALEYLSTKKKRAKALDKYLKENVLDKKHTFSCKQLVIMGLNNIQVISATNMAILQINPSALVPYYIIKITDICSFIDSGNLDVQGLHIFTYLFEYIKDNIETLRQMYESGVFK